MRLISRRGVLGVFSAASLGGFALGRDAQSAEDVVDPVVGTWTYRSLLNDPDINKPFNDLKFAAADLIFEKSAFGKLSGKLSFGTDYLKLTGAASYGNPFALRFEGVGATSGTIENGKPWIYDYQGYLVPSWPNGVDQRPAIVGSVIRMVTHSDGQAKAGFVASFIAVRRDS
jgi:hypothetical protein